jgi:hypothetical protein
MNDDEAFWSLVERVAADTRWMRRVRRRLWLAHWGESLLEMSTVWGVLGPIGPIPELHDHLGEPRSRRLPSRHPG